MQRLTNHSTLTSISGTFGELQLVSSATGGLVLDVQARYRNCAGVIERQHAVALLPRSAVAQLRDRLDDIVDPPDPRQTAMWSLATFDVPSPSRKRGRFA